MVVTAAHAQGKPAVRGAATKSSRYTARWQTRVQADTSAGWMQTPNSLSQVTKELSTESAALGTALVRV